jgi:hypothetical protein
MQAGLVPLDDQQVARAALVQVFGVGMLGVQGIGGDDGVGDLDAVQERGSVTLASTASRPGGPSASPARSARWPIARSIGDDDRAGMVPQQ